jgi:threonine aldolase
MNFASDNAAGVAPAILEALGKVNGGHMLGYGNDAVTGRLAEQFNHLFEREVAVYLVPTGTACNALALAHVSPPWGGVLCHHNAHIVTSEAGAPEFFGGGLKLIELAGEGGKITPEILQAKLDGTEWGGPHHVTPSVLSLTQVTEAGTLYRVDEVAQLAQIAHGRKIAVHMDGARFANAVASLNASPAEASWKAGIDVLSFGATKGGAMAAEAIVFFDKAKAEGMGERRKRGGQLVSKHRFVAAQFEAFLADGYWLKLARHANDKAKRLGDRLAAAGFPPVWSVEGNLVFAVLPKEAHARLTAAKAMYYAQRTTNVPKSVAVTPGAILARMVTSFATTDDEVDRFVAIAAGK